MNYKTDFVFIRALGPDLNSLPLGVLYLKLYLEKFGFQGEVIDRYIDFDISRVHEKLKRLAPKVIGISAMSAQFSDAIYIASLIRKWFGSSVKIIMGGVHFTALPESARDIADHVVIGEGEQPMLDYFNNQCDVIDYIIKGKSISDLGEIPSIKLKDINPFIRSKEYFHLITARGCPYKCNFCLDSTIRSTRMRYLPLDPIIDYVSEIVAEKGIRSFFIVDDIFVLNPKRVEQFCTKIIEKIKYPISLECFTHAGHGSLELYSLMKKAGFVKINLGVEHGNQRMLDFCGKKTTKIKIEKTCEEIVESGINLSLSYILGNATETHETITETVDFAIYLHKRFKNTSWFSYMQPLPGSPVYNEIEKYGRIIDQESFDFQPINTAPVFLAHNVSDQHLVSERQRGMKQANSQSRYHPKLRERLRKILNKAKVHKNPIENELLRVNQILQQKRSCGEDRVHG